MGFSSFKCAKSKMSIPAYPYAGMPQAASVIVVLFSDGSVIKGTYDGYGALSDECYMEGDPAATRSGYIYEKSQELAGEPIDLKAHERHAIIVRMDKFEEGDTYESLKAKRLKSTWCKAQGFFYSQSEARKIFLSALKVTGAMK
jgi:hypothetical protein